MKEEDDANAFIQEPPPPPTVEGRKADDSEIAAKASNGRYYLNDVWKIVREFPSADNYECGVDLQDLARVVAPAVHANGFLALDSSTRLDNLHHALHLAEAWASIVREARTSKVMHILRRTPENCGAMLMVQRQEHIRGYVDESAPIALIVVCKNDQLLLTRDEIPKNDTLCPLLLEMTMDAPMKINDCIYNDMLDELVEKIDNAPQDTTAHEQDIVGSWCKESPNMPDALFKQQMHAVRVMMDAMGVPPPPPPKSVIVDEELVNKPTNEMLEMYERVSDIDEQDIEDACVDVASMSLSENRV